MGRDIPKREDPRTSSMALCAVTSVGYACHLALPSFVCTYSNGAADSSAACALLICLVKVASMLILAACARESATNSLLSHRRALAWSLAAVGLLSMSAVRIDTLDGGPAPAVCEALFSIATCIPAVAWIESFFTIYRRLGQNGCLATSGLCYLVNALLLACRSVFATTPGTVALTAVSFLGTALCLVAASRLVGAATPTRGAPDTSSFRIPPHLSLVVAALGITWKLTNQFVGQGGIIWSEGEFSMWGLAVGGVLAGALLVAVPKSRFPEFGLLLRWAVTLTGITWLLAPRLTGPLPLVGSTLAGATYVFQGALMPCLIAGACYSRKLPVAPTAASLLAIFRAGGTLGIVLSAASASLAPAGAPLDYLSLTCASVLFLLVPFVPSRTASAGTLAMDRYPEDQKDRTGFEDALRTVADDDGLTNRESDILVLLFRGMDRKEIACELGISPNTVKRHLGNMFDKTGARSVPELMGRAACTVWDSRQHALEPQESETPGS